LPPLHAPPLVHAVASATQTFVPVSQHPVPPHVEPAQHGSPGPPHAWHAPFRPHASVASLQLRPAQHCWPGPPHAAHVFVPLHARVSPVQVFPAQHGSPAPPQWTQLPPTHVAEPPVHV
jgi:hypothetical protein